MTNQEEPISFTLLASIRTIGALSIVLIPIIFSTWPIVLITRRLARAFADLVPLSSLVPAEPPSQEEKRREKRYQLALWRQMILVLVPLIATGVWTAMWSADLLAATHGEKRVVDVLLSAGMALVWLYLFAQTLHHPPSTPPWTATTVYTLLWTISAVDVGMLWYTRIASGHYPAWATRGAIAFDIANLAGTSLLLTVIGGLYLAAPETLSRLPSVALDDSVTLWSWLAFTWVNPFITLGNSQELSEEDLPKLSLSQQTAVCFDRFKSLAASSLLRRLFAANSLDLLLDCSLTIVGVVLNYAGPFFLKRILDGLTDRSGKAMASAYVYALFSFLTSVLKALTDLLHLWHSRRATVRIKAELIAAIYDKALRRRDVSGVIAEKEDEDGSKDKPDAKEKKAKKGKGKKEESKKELKTGADSGKIVNLMAGDTNRISNTVGAAYYIYGAPFEIVVASVFLYNIMGWSAFAGVVVLAVATPINSFISKRQIKITQTLLKARDKRISVMNELIGAIQFIKFFAWNERWKARAAEARKGEMKEMVRSMINGIWFSLLWNLAPIFVTLVSFFCYIVIAKRDLTVSVAFTAISLFTMVRMPLNVIPTFVVYILQAQVSVKRIEEYLGEEEVPDWVSSLKRDTSPTLLPTKIGFDHATLRWNSGKQSSEEAKSATPTIQITAPPASPTASNSSSNDTTAVASARAIFQLSNLNIYFPVGKLSVISGPTGSGKTALLTALLGEMDLVEGKISLPKFTTQVDPETKLRNSVAYAAQTPWLQQKSIKDNILFGEEMDEQRYEATLDACALLPDLDMLEDGDATEIGAKGVSLSGGQKARVALARAVYSYTQHMLLDDPLAAVDSHTAKHLTDKCLNGPLLKGRTVILVSHHVELLLPSTDYLIRLLDGRVDAQGHPDELRARGELDGLVAVEEAEAVKNEPVVAAKSAEDEIESVDQEEKKAVKKQGPGKKLIQDEERAVGNVKWQTYKLYIVAATYATWLATLVVLVLSQVFDVGERYWLKVWGEAYTVQTQPTTLYLAPQQSFGDLSDHSHFTSHQHVLHAHAGHMVLSSNVTYNAAALLPKLPSADVNPGFYLWVYAIIVITDALLGGVSSAVGSWGAYRAAVNIHDRLLDRVMRATIRFFNTTPTGRIINRFSRDVETIDSSLSGALRTVMIYVASLFAAIGVVAVIVPWFLLPATVISYLYWRYTVLYLRAGRSVRRLEATLRSPIYSGFAELLDGVVSVRAFGVEQRFMTLLCEQVDKTHSAFYYNWMMNRWLLLRFDILGAISKYLTTLFALSGAIAPGSAGMAVLSAQSFVSACYWVSRFWGQLEMDFNAVERVEEYLQLPQEPPSTIENRKPPAYWPSSDSGSSFLSVRELEVKYAPDLPTVFKGSFDIAAGEKIGLIGRTGSGKSTLAMSLLRFAEPAGGSVWLDGIDITSIGVDDLRSRITYIPQDAVLFSGTVRENLDPFNEHSDEDLLDALARVNLGPKDTPGPSRAASSRRLTALVAEDAETASRPDSPAPSSTAVGSGAGVGKVTITLTTDVSAGGSNFSQGQRQLVAMARALLRRSNLIIMDEATASVDFATDEAIQAAIRTEFKSSTLLTIAHRLSSVIDYDRLLVLSDGKVAEFDTPINLLRKETSLFKTLCEKSGKYRDLYRAAENKERGSE